jgi:hypothetical protein
LRFLHVLDGEFYVQVDVEDGLADWEFALKDMPTAVEVMKSIRNATSRTGSTPSAIVMSTSTMESIVLDPDTIKSMAGVQTAVQATFANIPVVVDDSLRPGEVKFKYPSATIGTGENGVPATRGDFIAELNRKLKQAVISGEGDLFGMTEDSLSAGKVTDDAFKAEYLGPFGQPLRNAAGKPGE